METKPRAVVLIDQHPMIKDICKQMQERRARASEKIKFFEKSVEKEMSTLRELEAADWALIEAYLVAHNLLNCYDRKKLELNMSVDSNLLALVQKRDDLPPFIKHLLDNV